MTAWEIERIRLLASEYMEMVNSDRQKESTRRFKATNDLKIVRPPVLMDEIPWYQLNGDGELECKCEDERLRRLEHFFLTAKYRWKHFACDTNFEPFYKVETALESSGIGLETREKTLRTDDTNNIVSHEYEDLLEDESALDLVKIPTFKTRPDLDEERMNFYSDLLGSTMPVKLVGRNYCYYAPWDRIARLRGMTAILFDLYDRPEYMHAIRKRWMDITLAELDFVEKNSFVNDSTHDVHCTPAQISGLEGKTGYKATWLRTMAQPFGDVSPEMHDEFELTYVSEVAKRFGYT